MLTKLLRLAGLVGALVALAAPAAPAATPKEIDRALKAGTDALKARAGGGQPGAPGVDNSLGGTCLVGLALLEAGVSADDAAVKAITTQVRDAAYAQTATYPVALCLMYLDRRRDPADVPVIQMLAARLIAGQTRTGGWTYACIAGIAPADEARLRNAFKGYKPDGGPPKMHPDVADYLKALIAARPAPVDGATDDNSNTQFGVLAVWIARKHGAPVDATLALVEARFAGTQDARTGNWPYAGGTSTPGSPAMYCAGLLGMATGLARREERRLKGDAPAPPPPKKADAPKPDKPTDPFYNPPAGTAPAKKPAAARPVDPSDRAVQLAFAGLGLTFKDLLNNRALLGHGAHGYGDLYFLWSLERVGVVYGVDKIGGIDWYDIGSTAIVRTQAADGTWTVGGYAAEVNTAFAVLFLCRSNLAQDLASKVQKDPTSTEMRAGSGPSATDLLPNRPTTPVAAALPVINLPNPSGDPGITQGSKLLKSTGSDWAKLLAEARDAKGPANTRALVLAATHSDGDRKAAAREALAERLCRMTPDTLRATLKADEAEARRGAALACAMKDDRDHIPDLIALLTDADDSVVRAAKGGLKSLSGKDFGPPTVPTSEQKAAAKAAWADWYAKEKK